ncbi:glycosyltransferase family 2 protein [Patescibacteria group bacterium]|nr:glycosyltransferase family 2 protein [Patescibacteria group bacterium]
MISAVVLTHNDEERIRTCLKSLAWCGERIVIDDRSEDRTRVIAGEEGAQVLTHELGHDFAAQRNFGLSKAKGEWILFVDSDEVVTPQLAREIQEELEAADKVTAGYFFHRTDWWGGGWLRHGETACIRLVRLGRMGFGEWERPVHEVWKIRGQVGSFRNPLTHYPHSDVAQFISEINRYTTEYARYLKSQGIHEPSWYIVAKPAAKFLRNYLFRMGFLDGTAGMVLALMMSFHSFLTRAKLYLLWHSGAAGEPPEL